LVVAVSGSVVAVPLVGWVPLHPPDAEQVCASFALHCNVVAVPMTTLLFVATKVTAGFAVPANRLVWVVWLDDDCPHAANTDNVTHPSAQRMRREALT
jgi:hypothetical protein